MRRFRYDITNPIGAIFCSSEIIQHVMADDCYHPVEDLIDVTQDTPPHVGETTELKGFLINDETYDVASVILDTDLRKLANMAVVPFPPEVLEQVIPWALKGDFWKEHLVWGHIFPLDNTINALVLGIIKDEPMEITSCKRVSRPKGSSKPQMSPKNKFYTNNSAKGLIRLIKASTKDLS